MEYLTATRFKTLGFGNDLTDVPDTEIRGAIRRASAAINAFCAVPTRPQPFSFRGGTITGEEHEWPVEDFGTPRPLRIWPWHAPIRAVTACRLIFGTQGGSEYFLDIDPDNIVVVEDQGYIEISSVNLSTLVFADAIVPYIGLQAPITRTSYTYGDTFGVVDEPATAISTTVYQADNEFWTDADVVVKDDGNVVDSADYAVQRTTGRVAFTIDRNPDHEITLSYTHTLHPDISAACGILTSRELSEAELRKKGMGGLAAVRVKDVELRRFAPSAGGRAAAVAPDMADEAYRLLVGHQFVTAR